MYFQTSIQRTSLSNTFCSLPISNITCLVNPQNGSQVLFTISRNSLYPGSLYRGLSVHDVCRKNQCCLGKNQLFCRINCCRTSFFFSFSTIFQCSFFLFPTNFLMSAAETWGYFNRFLKLQVSKLNCSGVTEFLKNILLPTRK